MKIAYFSPMPPLKTGIADFSYELLKTLHTKIEVDVFTDQNCIDNLEKEKYKVYPYLKFEEMATQYDHIVYHTGNNTKFHKPIIDMLLKYPGIIEIHDLSLHYYLAEDTIVHGDYDKYISIMSYCHGKKGEKAAKAFKQGKIRAPWETHSDDFTVNKHLIDKSTGVIVHSDMAKQLVKAINKDIPVINIPLHAPVIVEDYMQHKRKCKDILNIDENTIVVGSFGFATGAKRILSILEALAIYKEKINVNNIHYYIVGQVEHIDVKGTVKRLGLEKNVTVTGFVDLEKFNLYMGACDFCFNLRYPTQGESSASLHRMLGLGKPVLVSKIGSFDEYPNNIVFKISYDTNEVNDIYNTIYNLVDNPKEIEIRAKEVYEFAKANLDINTNGERYSLFFTELSTKSFKEEYVDVLIDRLFDIGTVHEEYIHHLFTKRIGIFDEKVK